MSRTLVVSDVSCMSLVGVPQEGIMSSCVNSGDKGCPFTIGSASFYQMVKVVTAVCLYRKENFSFCN